MHQITPFSEEDTFVGGLAEILALKIGIEPTAAYFIGKAAELHDVGKNRISSHIIDKPDILTPDEFRQMKTHTLWGANMLLGLHGSFGVLARNICLWHHERYDKTGYWGKAAAALPAYIPVVSICDVYCALTSANRPYKQPWTHNQTLGYIESEAGRQFCPVLTKTFLALMADNAVLRKIAA